MNIFTWSKKRNAFLRYSGGVIECYWWKFLLPEHQNVIDNINITKFGTVIVLLILTIKSGKRSKLIFYNYDGLEALDF